MHRDRERDRVHDRDSYRDRYPTIPLNATASVTVRVTVWSKVKLMVTVTKQSRDAHGEVTSYKFLSRKSSTYSEITVNVVET